MQTKGALCVANARRAAVPGASPYLIVAKVSLPPLARDPLAPLPPPPATLS